MNEDITLFDKYGGVSTITEVVRAFYKEVLSRPHFQKYFQNINMEKLILHQIEFVSFAMGKPKSHYPDSRLEKGHEGLKINNSEFNEIASILQSVLVDFKVDKNDIVSILDAIESKRNLIVSHKT